MILACLAGMVCATSNAQNVTGQWNGTWLIVNPSIPVGRWASEEYPTGSILEVSIFGGGESYFASLYVPELRVDATVPAAINGDSIVLGPPGLEFAFGTIAGDSIAGIAFVEFPGNSGNFLQVAWQVQRAIVPDPGFPSGGSCNHGIATYCPAGADDCTSLVQFDPYDGEGYLDYLVGEETFDNQNRSWVRRDLMQVVKFAAAELQCQGADWDFGISAPIGLGDSSRADGTSPPGHISHTNGDHIDIAYPQLYSPDNLLRPVGRYDIDTGYLIGPPSALDPYRSAMVIAALGRHPNLWYIAVDEEAAQLIDVAFADLEARGWLPVGTRESIQLISGDQVTAGHHDHMHVAMEPLAPIVAGIEFSPQTFDTKRRGRFFTAYIEPVDSVSAGDIDVDSIRLIADGTTLLSADPKRYEIADFNGNGLSELMVKFDGRVLADVLEPGEKELAVTGWAAGSGGGSQDQVFFQETAAIYVR